MALFVIVGIAVVIFVIWAIVNDATQRKAVEDQKIASREAAESRREWDIHRREEDVQERDKILKHDKRNLDESKHTITLLLNEARDFHAELKAGFLKGRQWLANAFADWVEMRDLEVECWLIVKEDPALKAAETVSAIRAKHKETVRALKLLEYQLASYEEYFPVLCDYRDAILDEAVDLRDNAEENLDNADPALSRGFLSKEEYDKLTTTEKFQLALDRYCNRKKSRQEIGRVYERYIGYVYETNGWSVTYEGALKGFEDFGRDLICRKESITHVVQCKCWSLESVIREKHMFQLFGTTVLYRIKTPDVGIVTPVFATTTELSKDAQKVAEALGVKVCQEPLQPYPLIKCNINPQSREKIYHLPFDQQYDNVMIGNVDGERFARTVAEAEATGFRRAFRWTGG